MYLDFGESVGRFLSSFLATLSLCSCDLVGLSSELPSRMTLTDRGRFADSIDSTEAERKVFSKASCTLTLCLSSAFNSRSVSDWLRSCMFFLMKLTYERPARIDFLLFLSYLISLRHFMIVCVD